jgi:SAM-dependent MidA family methyltransferase
VIANEVLDAIPTRIVRFDRGAIEEVGVGANAENDGFERACRPASGALLEAARALDVPEPYETEINLAARAFVRTVSAMIESGAAIFIDYGFPAREYYHPQRSRGTLMCHYRHHAHDDPLSLVGLQDITSHVDFTAIADAALDAGLHVLGYTTQAQFLLDCGITDLLAETSPDDVEAYAPLASQAHKLLGPHEMGELFKVMAIGRGVAEPLVGFSRDRTHTL